MRDPNRLDAFYDALRDFHKTYCPDWRFGQLIINFLSEYGDPFYWEETTFLDKLDEYKQKIWGE